MLAFGLFILFGFGIVCVPAQHGHHGGVSRFCLSCADVLDPSQCKHEEWCGGDQYCRTIVSSLAGVNHYELGCFGGHDCEHQHDSLTTAVGKRQPGHHLHGTELCKKCCTTGNNCNRDLCVPTCRDHEEDGFLCSHLDSLNFCNDPSSIAHFMAWDKCPKHCGHCGKQQPTSAVPLVTSPIVTAATSSSNPDIVTSPAVKPCVDIEDNGFLCANFDIFHFCTDKTSFAYPLADEKCRKHCHIC